MISDLPTLPRGWSATRLDHVATVNARIGWKALTAAEYVDQGVAFLATPNIKSDEIDFVNVNYVTEFRYEESPELKLRVGDVLLAKDGNTLGITNVVSALPRPATVNGSIAVLRPHGIDARFLRYVLASDLTQGLIQAVRAGMGVPHLFQADIKKFPLPLPLRPEQRAIADFLDRETARIDALIAAKRRMIDLMSERRQVAIDRSLTSERNARVRHLVSRVTSGPRGWAEYVADNGCPFLRITNVSASDIELDLSDLIFVQPPSGAERERTMVFDGDVLVSITAEIGSVGLARSNQQGAAVSQHIALLTPVKCSGEWLAYSLVTSRAKAQLDAGRYGGTKTQLSLDDVRDVVVSVVEPAAEESILTSLARDLQRIRAIQRDLRQQIGLLAERRQALITAAVTGQIEIPGVAA